jgi:hypothetical protein
MDTLNFYRMSLERLGKQLGERKLLMPEDGDSVEDWDTYCQQDVRVIYNAMLQWWRLLDDWDLGNFAITLPAQALTAFRHRFMSHKIFIDAHEEALALSRSAYKGGRVECFKLGRFSEMLYQVDVNSEYAYIMRDNRFPSKLVGFYRQPTMKLLGKWLSEYGVVATVTVNTDQPVYHYYQENRLMFPIGTFTTTLTTPELLYGVERGHIQQVHVVALYEMEPLFTKYIRFFFKQRRNAKVTGNLPNELICKLFLNSFYGKWGQNGRKWVETAHTDIAGFGVWNVMDARTHTTTRVRQVGKLVQTLEESGESMESHPAIAAHITAHARMYLWSLIIMSGRENVYYVDTDSLIVNEQGFENLTPLRHDVKLGALKLEHKGDDVEIRGLKDYTIEQLIKIKGVRPKAKLVGPGKYEQVQFRGMAGMLADGDGERVLIREVVKTLTRNYTKGTVTESGLVIPFELG